MIDSISIGKTDDVVTRVTVGFASSSLEASSMEDLVKEATRIRAVLLGIENQILLNNNALFPVPIGATNVIGEFDPMRGFLMTLYVGAFKFQGWGGNQKVATQRVCEELRYTADSLGQLLHLISKYDYDADKVLEHY